jgi:hypothetical protein
MLKIQLTGKMKDGRLVHLVVLGLSRTNLARRSYRTRNRSPNRSKAERLGE